MSIRQPIDRPRTALTRTLHTTGLQDSPSRPRRSPSACVDIGEAAGPIGSPVESIRVHLIVVCAEEEPAVDHRW